MPRINQLFELLALKPLARSRQPEDWKVPRAEGETLLPPIWKGEANQLFFGFRGIFILRFLILISNPIK
jgi:hypothetical protein